mmetsp:Transcript_3166/g.13056  ORF Transcript_3166/g.13056 Transcript_3166/m.13056 type:complete len:368 (+) Transcript_3166:406-1509(+)
MATTATGVWTRQLPLAEPPPPAPAPVTAAVAHVGPAATAAGSATSAGSAIAATAPAMWPAWRALTACTSMGGSRSAVRLRPALRPLTTWVRGSWGWGGDEGPTGPAGRWLPVAGCCGEGGGGLGLRSAGTATAALAAAAAAAAALAAAAAAPSDAAVVVPSAAGKAADAVVAAASSISHASASAEGVDGTGEASSWTFGTDSKRLSLRQRRMRNSRRAAAGGPAHAAAAAAAPGAWEACGAAVDWGAARLPAGAAAEAAAAAEKGCAFAAAAADAVVPMLLLLNASWCPAEWHRSVCARAAVRKTAEMRELSTAAPDSAAAANTDCSARGVPVAGGPWLVLVLVRLWRWWRRPSLADRSTQACCWSC